MQTPFVYSKTKESKDYNNLVYQIVQKQPRSS